MAPNRRPYVPAAGYGWLLPFYDPMARLLGGHRARKRLIEQADLQPHQRVLEVGCGTGELLLLIKQRHPDVEVVGLDPDPKALARARRKAERAAVSVQLDRGFSHQLPYPAGSFDRVFSSFMLHHLEPDEKATTLREVRRVLKPGGTLHLLDFGAPESLPRGLAARVFHSSHRLRDNFGGRILILLGDAGFSARTEVAHGSTLFGPLTYYRAAA